MKRLILVIACLFSGLVHAQAPINSCCSSGSGLSGSELIPMSQAGSSTATTTTPNAIKTFIGATSGVSSLAAATGALYLGASLSVNQQLVTPGITPWSPFNATNNVVTQTTGPQNVLRNGSETSWQHHKFLTQDKPNTYPDNIGIASFTGAISGTTLTVTGTPTGLIQLFQTVNDAPATTTTTQATAVGGTTITVASTTGIVAGQHITDTTAPRAIAGDITVQSVNTGTGVVTLNCASSPAGCVGFFGNNDTLSAPGVGSGDTIVFTSVLRGTEITQQLTSTATATVSMTAASPAVVTWVGSNLNIGQPVTFSGTVPTGVTVGKTYYVIAAGLGADNFEFAATPLGAAINTTGSTQTPTATAMLNAGTYLVSTSQTSPATGTETMTSAGGFCPEGVYIIPVGSAGTSNYVACSSITGAIGFLPTVADITVQGTLSDVIIRFPIDYVDASRFNCSTYTGGFCVSTDYNIQPVTFQLSLTYSANVTQVPTFDTKTSCPSAGPNRATANNCHDVWTNTTYDIAPVNLAACNSGAATPVQCPYSYIWTPTGIGGDYEVEFHTNNVPSGTAIYINGFELKQTPGATCAGTAPPCINLYPGPIEIPEVVSDRARNARFTQLIGVGYAAGWNPGNLGPVETSIGVAFSTTDFIASWPLQVTMRCNVWDAGGPKAAPTCAPPNFYYNSAAVGDYKLTVPNPTAFSATGLAVTDYGANSIAIDATTSGLTKGAVGLVTWGSGNSDLIMLDSAMPGG